ncbi:hypothetical protein COP2_043006 [Malus domestica]
MDITHVFPTHWVHQLPRSSIAWRQRHVGPDPSPSSPRGTNVFWVLSSTPPPTTTNLMLKATTRPALAWWAPLHNVAMSAPSRHKCRHALFPAKLPPYVSRLGSSGPH